MLDTPEDSLRLLLRRGTSVAHEGLDRRAARLDLACRDDLGIFLAMQEAAFAALSDAGAAGRAASAAILREIAEAARSDLATLGAPRIAAPRAPSGLHPVAVDYVVLGSRLGTRVLRQIWIASADPQVRAASRYFGLPALGAEWRAHCAMTRALAPAGPEAETILSDANAIFGVFAAALTVSLATRTET